MNKTTALIASLLMIATSLSGCITEELVDDVLGCMDENAENYDENATLEALGDCFYMASVDQFMGQMSEMSIDEMLDVNPRAGYSSVIEMTMVEDEMGMGEMKIHIEEHVMVDLANDSAMVRTYLSADPMMTVDYTVIQVGQVVNIHSLASGMMADAVSSSTQTRDADGSVLDMVHAMIEGSLAEGIPGLGMGDDQSDSDNDGDMPTESASFTYDASTGTQTMTMSIIEDGASTEMTIHLDENEDLVSYEMNMDDGTNTTVMSYTVMWGDAVVIEVDETLPKTALPVWFDGLSETLDDGHGDDDGDDGDGPPSPEEVLHMFDSDGDGYLSWDEFWYSWDDGESQDAQDDLIGIFYEADTDSDDLLSLEELDYFIEMVQDYDSHDGDEMSPDTVLDMMDYNDDGSVSWTEFDDFIIYEDGGWENEQHRSESQAAFNGSDANGDGALDYDELEHWLSTMGDDDESGDGITVEFILEMMDSDEDGMLTWEELDNFMQYQDGGYESEEDRTYFQNAFNSTDENNDDYLDYGEIELFISMVFEDNDEEMFVCDNGEEVPMDWVNDGEEDCEDGSDENTQTNQNMQNSNEFPVSAYLTDNWASSDQDYVDPEFTIDSGFDDVDSVDFELMDSEGWSLMTLTVQPSDFIETDDGSMLYYVSLDGLTAGPDWNGIQSCFTLTATLTTYDGNTDTWTRDDICIYEDNNDDGDSDPLYGVVADNLTFTAPLSDFELRFLNCNGADSLEECSLVASGLLESGVASAPGEANCVEGCDIMFTFIDSDMDGMVSPGDTLEIGDDYGFTVAIYDTWAEGYTEDSHAFGPNVPGFGALLGAIALIGASMASRRD